MEKEYAIARKKLRGMMNQAATEETGPNLGRYFRGRTASTIQDDGMHADPIPGLRPEPVYVDPSTI